MIRPFTPAEPSEMSLANTTAMILPLAASTLTWWRGSDHHVFAGGKSLPGDGKVAWDIGLDSTPLGVGRNDSQSDRQAETGNEQRLTSHGNSPRSSFSGHVSVHLSCSGMRAFARVRSCDPNSPPRRYALWALHAS